MINAVLRARNRLRECGGNIKLCGMRYSVRDAFRTLNLDGTMFDIHRSLQEALDAFVERGSGRKRPAADRSI